MCFNTVSMPTPSSNSDSSPSPAYPQSHSDTISPLSSSAASAPKGSIRKRVVRACEVCRRKKVKCNGQKPCSHCIAFAEECFYVDVKDRSAYSRRYVESLELRLAKLERAWAMVFENGGIGGRIESCEACCAHGDGPDSVRRASDPGTRAALRLENVRVEKVPMPLERFPMEFNSREGDRSATNSGKRRETEDDGSSVRPTAEIKRWRAATLPNSALVAGVISVPSSEMGPRVLPQGTSNSGQSHLGPQLSIPNASNPGQASAMPWSSTGELEAFFRDPVPLLPLPPPQPVPSPGEATQAQATLDASQEELAGFLRQFMDQETSRRTAQDSQHKVKQMH